MQTTHLKITGMSCDACVSHAKKALEAVPGVRSASVNLAGQEATVQHDGADIAKLLAAVAEEGYEAAVA
ncbi:MAG TPA: cation transporter [Chthoniobacteraceae bacterium]|nr:cation transporter [Chthoniobacteraceae bacterium]